MGKPPPSSEGVNSLLKVIDKNGDGKISKMELYEHLSKRLGI
jgi:Ca2+-binding EF-hand superfamily protein